MAEVAKDSGADGDPQVAMRDVVRFVRQLSHDLRNDLNAAELQAAFVTEIVADDEAKVELKRLRAMISEFGSSLQKLTNALGDVRMTSMQYTAQDFVDDMQKKIAATFPDTAAALQWRSTVAADVMLEIDPQLLQQALIELFDNAFRHKRGDGNIDVVTETNGDRFVLTLREPKKDFEGTGERWGREPLQTVSHGHYGLGLHRVRRILEAHQGELEAKYDRDAASLITTVRLPIAPNSAA